MMTADRDVKISIIMPVYNVEAYLQEAVASALNQTLGEIELICVEDCSTDGSLAVLQKAAREDSRVFIVRNEQNKGTFDARREGIRHARGKYILFLDADDALAPDACRTVWEKLETNETDILLFYSEVTAARPEMLQEAADAQANLNTDKIKGVISEDIALRCFKDRLFTYTVWNKAYRTDLCKKILEYEDLPEHMIVSEDLVFSLIVLFQARSLSVCDSKLYRYYLGRGVSGRWDVSLERFAKLCSGESSYRAAEQYLHNVNATREYFALVQQYRREFLENIVFTWIDYVVKKDADAAWNQMVSVWGAAEVIAVLAKEFKTRMYTVQEKLGTSFQNAAQEHPVKHIGIYCQRPSSSPDRAYMSEISAWTGKGYAVTLLTENPLPSHRGAALPGLKSILLPAENESQGEQYTVRAKAWEQAIRDNQIDTVVYAAYDSSMLPYDLLLLKSLECNTVIRAYSAGTALLRSLSPQKMATVNAYRFADRTVSISPVGAQFLQSFAPTYYIPHPVYAFTAMRRNDAPEKNVLWIGKCGNDSGFPDIMKAFSIVAAQIPDATLTAVCQGEAEEMQRLQAAIRCEKTGDRIKIEVADTDLTPYYRKAAVVAVTSYDESTCLTVAQARCFGIPVVMYDLCYLDTAADSRGVISVPRSDVISMAESLTGLLQSDAERQKIGLSGLAAAREQAAFDSAGEWDKLFQSFGNAAPGDSQPPGCQNAMLKQLMNDLSYGICCNPLFGSQSIENTVDGHDIQWYARQCNELSNTVAEIRKSTCYRIGCRLMYVPLQIKKLLGYVRKKK